MKTSEETYRTVKEVKINFFFNFNKLTNWNNAIYSPLQPKNSRRNRLSKVEKLKKHEVQEVFFCPSCHTPLTVTFFFLVFLRQPFRHPYVECFSAYPRQVSIEIQKLIIMTCQTVFGSTGKMLFFHLWVCFLRFRHVYSVYQVRTKRWHCTLVCHVRMVTFVIWLLINWYKNKKFEIQRQ